MAQEQKDQTEMTPATQSVPDANPVSLPRDELFNMLDIADEMVRFCSVNMPAAQYHATAAAIWVIANRAAGHDEVADRAAGHDEVADRLLGEMMRARSSLNESGPAAPEAGV